MFARGAYKSSEMAFLAWRSLARARADARALAMTRVASRLRNFQTHRSFNAWSSAVAERRRLRVAARRVISRVGAYGVARAFKTWADAWAEGKRARFIVARLVARMSRRVADGAFRGWRHGVSERRRLKRLTTNVVRRMARQRRRLSTARRQGGVAQVEPFSAGRVQRVGDDARDGEAKAVPDDEGDGSIRPSRHRSGV